MQASIHRAHFRRCNFATRPCQRRAVLQTSAVQMAEFHSRRSIEFVECDGPARSQFVENSTPEYKNRHCTLKWQLIILRRGVNEKLQVSPRDKGSGKPTKEREPKNNIGWSSHWKHRTNVSNRKNVTHDILLRRNGSTMSESGRWFFENNTPPVYR